MTIYRDNRQGVHAIVDGQFGSTGKGLLSSYYAKKYGNDFNMVVSNAGPNSGHTSYFGDRKVVLKQLPTFAVMHRLFYPDDEPLPVFLSPGAVVNSEILNKEVAEYDVPVFIHPTAALIRPEDVIAEGSGSIAAVAGTRQGVGAAIARKVMRDPRAVVSSYEGEWHPRIQISTDPLTMVPWHAMRTYLEVSQGFSLGLNSEFYPKVTSRECTVTQAMADARMHPHLLKSVSMVIRTFPIRVGNHEGHSSGDCYPDQEELSWGDVGAAPELTTVTQRVRRVFSFSRMQFVEALHANRPNVIFTNFMNYIPEVAQRRKFAAEIVHMANLVLNTVELEYRIVPQFLWGYGPTNDDVYGDVR